MSLSVKLKKEYHYQTSKPKRILFDHLPKCGGTTINQYLLSHFPERFIFQMNGQESSKSIETFNSFTKRKRLKFRLIIGHHSNEIIENVHPECVVFTVLREPIDRIVSHYNYVKNQKTHYLHNKIVDENISLENYCLLVNNIELRNWYTNHFTGLSSEQIEKNPESALEKALQNIKEKYHLVGFQDDLPKVMFDLKKITGLKHPFLNELRNKTKREDKVTVEEINSIEEFNKVDIVLFNRLKEIYA